MSDTPRTDAETFTVEHRVANNTWTGTDDVGPYMGTLENIFSHPSLSFVLFDSPKELFKWLSE